MYKCGEQHTETEHEKNIIKIADKTRTTEAEMHEKHSTPTVTPILTTGIL